MDEIIVLELARHAVLLAVAIFAAVSAVRLVRSAARPAVPRPNGFSSSISERISIHEAR